ncbi:MULTISPECIES: DUF5361 domain-containing protein [Helcococcus]
MGLRDDSRVKQKYQSINYNFNTLLLAKATDLLSLLWWAKTKDGSKNRNRPTMITELLQSSEKTNENQVFISSEEFEKERKRIIKGGAT